MKKYYAVIDTNVLVSSMLKSDSIPGQIIDMILIGRIVPLLNEEIISEYEDVLTRNKFGFEDGQAEALIENIRTKAIFLPREHTDEAFLDEDDIVFFEIALSGRSTMDAYLVTGNKKHYPIKKFVVTPRQMLEIIENDPD